MSQEYTLLQIAKLHDPESYGGRSNLGLEYIRKISSSDEVTKSKLNELSGRLEELYNATGMTRNRVIAHNDLATAVAGTSIGNFKAGSDDAYFATLEEFLCVVQQATGNGPFEFGFEERGDVANLIDALTRSAIGEETTAEPYRSRSVLNFPPGSKIDPATIRLHQP